ncbi:hypothetical protein GQ44DRAFT_718778 [Phaeosphaeriaceae sp. PMI808]|nr:hypothetical protein GQ44DRAFT_718778 [Phaeosphaeriaceae sp. PMI808]
MGNPPIVAADGTEQHNVLGDGHNPGHPDGLPPYKENPDISDRQANGNPPATRRPDRLKQRLEMSAEYTSCAACYQLKQECGCRQKIVQYGNAFDAPIITADGTTIRGSMFENATRRETIQVYQHRNIFRGDVQAAKGAKDGSFYRENPLGAAADVLQDGHIFEAKLTINQGNSFQGNSYMSQGNTGKVVQGGNRFTGRTDIESGNCIQGNWAGRGIPDASRF